MTSYLNVSINNSEGNRTQLLQFWGKLFHSPLLTDSQKPKICLISGSDHLFWTSPSSGIVSLISLAVLSYERYCTMMAQTIADGRDFRPTLAGICFSWLYSVAWTVPPLLGWSRYGPEGPGTTCSVDWRTRTPNNISYIICLFTFCLVLPFGVILYSYGKLLHAIRQVRICNINVMRAFVPKWENEPFGKNRTLILSWDVTVKTVVWKWPRFEMRHHKVIYTLCDLYVEHKSGPLSTTSIESRVYHKPLFTV